MAGIRGLGKAIVGVFIGLLLVMICFPLIFWNEGRAITTAQSLQEGADAVVSIDGPNVEPDQEGELIHFTGEVDTDDRLADPEFPMEHRVLALQRSVEMYQWHEESDQRRSGTDGERERSYSYHTDWSTTEIDSSRFQDSARYRNPGGFPYDQFEARASDVTVGDFQLSQTFINELDDFSTVALDESFLGDLPDGLSSNAQIVGPHLYLGGDPNSPEVGDVRISFSVIQPDTASLIGAQQNSTLVSYSTDAGRDLAMVSAGHHSADEMFEDAIAENVAITWGLRFGGLIMMFIGFSLIFGPIDYVARFVPVVGRFISAASGMVAGGLTMILGGSTIAVAWLFYRPLIGIPLLMFVFLVTFALFSLAYLKFAKAPKEMPADEGMGTV